MKIIRYPLSCSRWAGDTYEVDKDLDYDHSLIQCRGAKVPSKGIIQDRAHDVATSRLAQTSKPGNIEPCYTHAKERFRKTGMNLCPKV